MSPSSEAFCWFIYFYCYFLIYSNWAFVVAKWNKVKFSLFFPAKFHLLLGNKFILNPPCVKRNLLHLFWLCLNIRREVKKTKSIPRLLKLQMVSKKRLEYTSQLNQIANVCALRLTRIDTSAQYEASAIYWEGGLTTTQAWFGRNQFGPGFTYLPTLLDRTAETEKI